MSKENSMYQPSHNHNKSAHGRKCGPLGRRAAMQLISYAVVASLLGMSPRPALAAADVQGRVDHIELRAATASIREILDALPADLRVTYRIAPSVVRVLTGQYSGTLYQVLARILDGYDYIVEISD